MSSTKYKKIEEFVKKYQNSWEYYVQFFESIIIKNESYNMIKNTYFNKETFEKAAYKKGVKIEYKNHTWTNENGDKISSRIFVW